jgi:hypothetical protein
MKPVRTSSLTATPAALRTTHVTVAIGYLLLLVLNGVQLERAAERLEYGARRDLALTVVRPLAALTRSIHAHVLRDRIAAWAERVGLSVCS